MAKRLALVMLVACISTAAWADGGYHPEPAYPAMPTIPLQRALIAFDNGVETLVVESSFESASPSVGWVLPLPAVPTKLAVADPGMLTSMSMSLRSNLVHDMHDWLELFIVLAVVAFAFMIASILTPNANGVLLTVAVLWLLAVLLLPALSTAGGRGPIPGAVVEVASSQHVGNYDVSVLRADTAKALSDWLKDNSLQPLGATEAKAVDDYISRGWCFVVAKLRRDAGGAATPHPIAASFPVKSPIYPMKLTAFAGSTTRVELFVVARQMARADGFHCVTANEFSLNRRPWPEGTVPCYEGKGLTIGSPDAGAFLWDNCVVTKLTADMKPAQMDRDVELGMKTLTPHRDRVFSERGRLGLVYCILLAGLCVTFIALAVIFRHKRRPRARELKALAGLVAVLLVIAGYVYFAVPVVPVRSGGDVGGIRGYVHERQLTSAAGWMAADGVLNAGMTDKELSEFPDLLASCYPTPADFALNPLTGEKMRMERTPGNFSRRVVDGVSYFCLYDIDGREHRVELPPAGTQPKQKP